MQLEKVPYLKIKVTPRSHKTEIQEVMADGTIKIRLKSVPEKGKANAELIKFLSKELSVAKENISIIAGKSEQTKLIKINWT